MEEINTEKKNFKNTDIFINPMYFSYFDDTLEVVFVHVFLVILLHK